MRIVGGEWSGRRIGAPAGRATRPTTDRVREAWMSAIAPRIPHARAADLFAGTGALGIELLSRGAEHVTFVENGAPALKSLRANLSDLKASADLFQIVRADVPRYLHGVAAATFDVAVADPPYDSELASRVVELWRETRFAKLLCVEHAPAHTFEGTSWHRRYGDTALSFFEAE